jgi:hypothetical protein
VEKLPVVEDVIFEGEICPVLEVLSVVLDEKGGELVAVVSRISGNLGLLAPLNILVHRKLFLLLKYILYIPIIHLQLCRKKLC